MLYNYNPSISLSICFLSLITGKGFVEEKEINIFYTGAIVSTPNLQNNYQYKFCIHCKLKTLLSFKDIC